jgi:hypothetical protein
VAELGAMLGPWLAGFSLDHGLDAKDMFFVFAVFPDRDGGVAGGTRRVQRGLPVDQDGSAGALVGRPTRRAAVRIDGRDAARGGAHRRPGRAGA